MAGFGEDTFPAAGGLKKGKFKDPDMVKMDFDAMPSSPGLSPHVHGHKKVVHDTWATPMQAHDVVDRTPPIDWQGGSLVSRLASQPAPHNKLGRLLNQLQVLGMDKTHLSRLESQLIAAVGDDSGKKLRLLQQAIHRLVTDRSYPDIPRSEPPPPPPEMEIDEQVETARSVTTYEQTGYSHWIQQGDSAIRPDETLLRAKHTTPYLGDSHDMMLEGRMTTPAHAVEELFDLETGQPMLSAAVTMDMPDYLGATQLGHDDKLNTRLRLIPSAEDEQAVATSRAEQFRDLRNVTKSGPKRVQSAVMAGIHHPHENAKAAAMRRRLLAGGRCNAEQEHQAPCPGTEFWRSLVAAPTDATKSGACGGNMLSPPLRLQVPETICFVDANGGTFFGFYTERDGCVYRGALPKDAAVEWLGRMRRSRLRKMAKRKPYRVLEREPVFVVRVGQGEAAGNEVRALTTEAQLKSSMNEVNPQQLTLWQGFIRSRGNRAKIHRVVYNFGGGGEESGHYMLSSTVQMATAEAVMGGFFCLSSDLDGTKAQGRATVINNVQPGALESQVDAGEGQACVIAQFACHAFPFRRDRKGKLTQRYPKFGPERIAVDWLVDREGVWYFSQVYAFHARRLAAKGGVVVAEKPRSSEPDAMADTISLLEQHLSYIKEALQAAIPTMDSSLEMSKASVGPPKASDAASLLDSQADEGSEPDAASETARAWPERSLVRFTTRSRSKDSLLSLSAKSSSSQGLHVPATPNVYAPPLHTIARIAQNPRTQKTGTRLLRDAVVDRVAGDHSQSQAATATTPAGGGKAMAALDRRLTTLILSNSHAAPNPIHSSALQRRLGGISVGFEAEAPRRAQSALPRSESWGVPRSSSKNRLLDTRLQALSRPRPVSAAPIMTSAAITELKQSVTAAASALGHPI